MVLNRIPSSNVNSYHYYASGYAPAEETQIPKNGKINGNLEDKKFIPSLLSKINNLFHRKEKINTLDLSEADYMFTRMISLNKQESMNDSPDTNEKKIK